MTVKAIVCLDESPDFEVLADSVYVSDNISIIVRMSKVDNVELSDSQHTLIEPEELIDNVNVEDFDIVFIDEVKSTNDDISFSSEVLGYSLQIFIEDCVRLSDLFSHAIGDLLPFPNEPIQLEEELGFEMQIARDDGDVNFEDSYEYEIENLNMFNNRLIGESHFN